MLLFTVATLVGGLTTATSQAVGATPKSPLSAVTASLSNYSAGATQVTYKVGFTTPPTGALAKNKGTIDIQAPPGLFSGACGNSTITDLTTKATWTFPLGVCTYFGTGSADDPVDIPAPFAIGAGDHVQVAIFGLTNPSGTGAYSLRVGTSAASARSTTFRIVPAGRVRDVTVSRSDSTPGAALVTYTVAFTTSAGGALAAAPSPLNSGTIDIKAPAGTFGPGCGGDTITDLTTGAKSNFSLDSCTYWSAGPDHPDQLDLPVSFPVGTDNRLEVAISGLVNPAQPGLHSITVGTSSDLARTVPYHLASPPQDLSHVSVSLSSADVRATRVTYRVGFTPSAQGGLTANVSTFTLRGPIGTFSAAGTCGRSVATFTDLVTKASGTVDLCPSAVAAVTGGGAQATVVVPITIGPSQPAQVAVTGVNNAAVPGRQTMSVWTSADASVGRSYTLIGKGIAVSKVSVSLSTLGAKATRVTYSIDFTTSSMGALAAGGGGIVVTAPPGTFPVDPPCGQDVVTITDLTTKAKGQDDLCSSTESQNGSQLVLLSPIAVGGSQTVQVGLTGLNNPTATGTATLALGTTSNTPRAASYRIIPGSRVSGTSVFLSNRAAGSPLVTYALTMTVPITGALAAASGTVTLSGATGTFPSAANCAQAAATMSDLTTKASAPVTSCLGGAGASGTSLSLFVPFSVNGGDRLTVTVSNLTNPAGAGPQVLGVATSSDGVPARAPFSTVPAGTVTGVVGDSSGNPVVDGAVQACPARGGPCADAPTGANGAFRLVLPRARYSLSVYPPAGVELAPALGAKVLEVTSHSRLSAVNFTLRVLDPLPGKVTIDGQDSGVPTMIAFEPNVMTVHGCRYGFGDVMVRGTNVRTGKQTILIYPLFESRPGSGLYKETIPPVWPVHGAVTVSYSINCVEALAPKAGPAAGGNVVTIHGKGFTGATAVYFGPTRAPRFKVLSDSWVQAVAPPGSGTVTVSVRTPRGTIRGGALTSYGYVSLTSVTPSYGAAAGQTTVLLRGSNLGDGVSFWFGKLPVTDVHVISDHEVSVVTPPGKGKVRVSIGGLAYSLPGGLTPTAAGPGVPFKYRGGPPTTQGTAAALLRWAMRDSTGATGAKAPLAMASQSVGLRPPLALAGGSKPVPGGSGHYTPMPSSPSAVGVGGWNLTHSDLSYVFGFLASAAGATAFFFGSGVVAAVFVGAAVGFAFASAVEGITSNHSGNSGSFSGYYDPSGTVSSTNGAPIAGATAVLEQGPTPDGPFSPPPSNSPAITPHRNPQVTGSSGQFHWDVVADYYKVVASAPGCHAPGDPAQATVSTPVMVVPPPRSGLDLVLQCDHEATLATPAVTALSPDQVPTRGGEEVQVIGTAFTPRSQVRFGPKRATAVTYLSPELLEATVPPGRGRAQVRVTTAGGTSVASTGGALSYEPPPTVTAISATSGPVAGGTIVTISGSGLAYAEMVRVGSAELTNFTAEGNDAIQATMPAGKAGPVAIRVTTPFGQSALSSADVFTYLAPKPSRRR